MFKEERRSWSPPSDQQPDRKQNRCLGTQSQIELPTIFHTPSSQKTLLTQSLVRHLEASHDLRYHLTWVYGTFIEDIPRRIGSNEALDAAVMALMRAHSSLAVHRGTPPVACSDSLSKYSRALKTLRIYLDDPIKAREAETLCAVMILLICQSFLGTSGGGGYASGHGEGAAQIIKVRSYYNPRDDFEKELLLSLRGPILFEALINPKICFSPEEWKTLVESEIDEGTPEGQMMRCLAKAPSLMQRGRAGLRDQVDLTAVVSETRQQYSILKEILQEMEDRYNTVRDDGIPRSTIMLTKVHAHYQRIYGLALAVCLIFNCIYRALDPAYMELDIDAKDFSEKVLCLAEEAAPYRPLGASYILLCLITAWCGSRDEGTKQLVEAAYVDYRMDFPEDFQADATPSARAWLEYSCQRLYLLED
jgi:hypothetical protein